MRGRLLLLPLFVALACGPTAGQPGRQSVELSSAPDPAQQRMATCVDKTLATSAIARVANGHGGRCVLGT